MGIVFKEQAKRNNRFVVDGFKKFPEVYLRSNNRKLNDLGRYKYNNWSLVNNIFRYL